MIKLYTLLSLLCITSFNATQCMLTQGTEESTIRQNRHKDTYGMWANEINGQSLTSLKPIPTPKGIFHHRQATDEESKVTCLGYALAKTMNTPELLKFPLKLINPNYNKADLYRQKFFEKTDTPQTNDLVIYKNPIYKNGRESNDILHYSIFINKKTFESKFGINKLIVQHDPHAVPRDYIPTIIFITNLNEYNNSKDTISYWTLKKDFKTDQGKNILDQTIQHPTTEEDMDYFKNNYEKPTTQRFNFMLMATGIAFIAKIAHVFRERILMITC